MQIHTSRLGIALGSLLALGVVGASSGALAASPAADTMQGPGMQAAAGAWRHGGWSHGHGMMERRHAPFARGMPARFAAMRDLRALQHLYLMQGRRGDAEALYRQVLAHTADPILRNFAYARLARLQALPTNPDAAIATLRAALAENLKNIPAPAAATP